MHVYQTKGNAQSACPFVLFFPFRDVKGACLLNSEWLSAYAGT